MGRDFSSRSILKSTENQKVEITDEFCSCNRVTNTVPPGSGIYS